MEWENKDRQSTAVSTLGEFALIEHLTKGFELQNPGSLVGIGDDAAVIHFQKENGLISTDMLVEGVHFDLGYMPLTHLGYKSAVVNISDICAMNGRPTQLTLSLAVSNRFTLEALEHFYDGFAKACAHYKVDLVGGDTTSSNKGMIISVTVLGEAEKEKTTYRSQAADNELLVVSGDLGGAYLGLQVLEREKQVFQVNPQHQPDLEPYHYLVERQLKPEARLDIVELLEKLEVQPTAMIDISDGLSSEVMHLCQNSKLGCQLYEEKIPIDPTVISTAEEFKMDPTTVALNGGEDYELLFTIKQEDFPKIKGNPNLTVIGHMTEASRGAQLVTRSGELFPLQAQGWNAFNQED